MHGGYAINKMNEEAVRHHAATLQLNKEYAAKLAEAARAREIGVGSGGVSNGTDAQSA